MTAGTRPYHHGNLRATLLARAERTLAERGAGELSLRKLAREAGVSHAAPRRHFASKGALLDALALDGYERLGRELRAAADGAGDGFAGRLGALALAYVRFATGHAALLELMFAGKHRPGADGEALRAAADRTFAVPLAVIADGQAAGEIVPGDPQEVAVAVFAMLQGLTALLNGGMLDAQADDLVRGAVERLLLGLRPR